MITQLKRELAFYFATLFDTKYKMGVKQYRNQRLYISVLTFIPLAIFLIYVFFLNDTFIQSDAYYDLPIKEQDRLSSLDDFKFSLLFTLAVIMMKVIQLPFEIKRANFKNINWVIRILILVIGFSFIIFWSFYRYHQGKVTFTHEIIFFVVILNLVFGNNSYETEEEKELYKIHGEHI
ncbi:hypothetical protein BHU61_06025 [Macrococcus epidermidis]|uniref:Uncharacterized protein n=1 Tax=Macrococcus epidermidis TaxID=1902580 RepID=A0A327ZY41_9STAP|nr:hypothetical protein [Macrococcus epidermidis]MCG7419669.1 hypothetical protein [Macrococcus epidermidis]RAK47016.1 hypothetical protein BHU61_06025 [Macrococcus epidermidis]